jgi:chromosome segregation ATPase
LLQINELHQRIEYERTERKHLEERVRICEEQWGFQDEQLKDVQKQLREIGALPGKLSQALSSMITGCRSVQERIHQQQNA